MTVNSKTIESEKIIKFPRLRQDNIGNVYLFLDKRTSFIVGCIRNQTYQISSDMEPIMFEATYDFEGTVILKNKP